MPINESLGAFLDSLVSGLKGESWTPNSEPAQSELQWWSCALSVDAACRLMAGTTAETWAALGAHENDGFASLASAVQDAAAARFGSEVQCEGLERTETPDAEPWTAVTLRISDEASIEFLMSEEFVDAFGTNSADAVVTPSWGASSSDLLMNVEIPVSVSLGRKDMRIKDLLGLTHGSIVELEQELGDDVEIRVNNCVIARGEVVAVDGNYAVRILKMVSNDPGTSLRRIP
jgi:flagellar motor switch protein FliN